MAGRANLGTNQVIANNGVNEQTVITSFADLKDDNLFKYTSNFDGPNNYQGITVNKVFVNTYETEYSPTYGDNESMTWEFFTTHNTHMKNFFINIPVVSAIIENILPNDNTWQLEGWQLKPSTNSNDYRVPYKALSRLFTELEFRMGNLVQTNPAVEQYKLGISLNMAQLKTGFGHPDEIYQMITGDNFSVITNRTQASSSSQLELQGSTRNVSGVNDIYTDNLLAEVLNYRTNSNRCSESNFLNVMARGLFIEPFTDSNNKQIDGATGPIQKRLTIPLSYLLGVFQSDSYLPAGIKIQIKIKGPILKQEYSQVKWTKDNKNLWTNASNFSLMALNIGQVDTPPAGQTLADLYNNIKTYGSLKDIKKGLVMAFNKYAENDAYITTIGHVLEPVIAESLAKEWIQRPLVLNNEFYTSFIQDWNPSMTTFTFQHVPNVNLPQQIILAIMNSSNPRYVPGPNLYSIGNVQISSSQESIKTEKDPVRNNNFVFEQDPLPLLLKKLEVTMGQYPLIKWEPKVKRPIRDSNNKADDFVNLNSNSITNQYGNSPFHQFTNRKNCEAYFNKTTSLKTNLLMNNSTNPDINNMSCEYSTFFTFSPLPEPPQRGRIQGDLAAHVMQFRLEFDTEHPMWPTFVKMCGSDVKIYVIRQQYQQVSITVDGNVKITQWPAITIAGNGFGQTTQVTSNPPNGTFA